MGSTGNPGVSSRLLQGTSASLAKSGVTPTLTRKFGTPKSQKTPTTGARYGDIGYRYNSGKKKAQNASQNMSGPKFAASTAKKKVVMNSTSESENVVPTDWDASAISVRDASAIGPRSEEQPKKDV